MRNIKSYKDAVELAEKILSELSDNYAIDIWDQNKNDHICRINKRKEAESIIDILDKE